MLITIALSLHPDAERDGLMPTVLSSYDEYLEDTHGGVPEYYSAIISESRHEGAKVQEIELDIDDDDILSLFSKLRAFPVLQPKTPKS